MEWRDGKRPDHALLIVILFDRRSGRPSDADAVASHEGEALLALIVENGGVHFFAVLGAEHEYLSDFDPFGEREHTCSSGRRISGMRIAEIGKLLDREISVELASIVGIGFVAANDHVFQGFDGVIRNNSYVLQTNGPGKPGRSPRDLFDGLGIGQYKIGDLE